MVRMVLSPLGSNPAGRFTAAGIPYPASMMSRLSISMAPRRFCWVSATRFCRVNEAGWNSNVAYAALIAMKRITNAAIISTRVKPASENPAARPFAFLGKHCEFLMSDPYVGPLRRQHDVVPDLTLVLPAHPYRDRPQGRAVVVHEPDAIIGRSPYGERGVSRRPGKIRVLRRHGSRVVARGRRSGEGRRRNVLERLQPVLGKRRAP